MFVFVIGATGAVDREVLLGIRGYAEYVSGNWPTLGNCLV